MENIFGEISQNQFEFEVTLTKKVWRDSSKQLEKTALERAQNRFEFKVIWRKQLLRELNIYLSKSI